MSAASLTPVQQRLDHLDVLRGFALLGIFMVNFAYFTLPIQAIALGPDPGLSGPDRVVDFLIAMLFTGKFVALFSILFGAGFALMAGRAAERGAPFWGVYLRRLLVLAAFGLAHLLLVWSGDILLVYALCALFMILFFRTTPTRRLWKWAVVFFAVPSLVVWLGVAALLAAASDPDLQAGIQAGFEQAHQELVADVEQAAVINATGSWTENVGQRARDMQFLFSSFLFWVPPIVGFFLIGRWLIETQRLLKPNEHRMFFRRWRSRGLVLGLPLGALAAWLGLVAGNLIVPSTLSALALSFYTLAAVVLSLAYLSLVMLGAQRLGWLAPVGRMALTNYLLQSLLWTWIFYGHGLGLWGQLPRWSHPLFVLAFFAVQVGFSHWWMARFRFGPAEWLWRSLTYLSLQPMRRRPAGHD